MQFILTCPNGKQIDMSSDVLKQMDGVGSGSNEGVTVVAATNLPTELDSALRRRFEKRV